MIALRFQHVFSRGVAGRWLWILAALLVLGQAGVGARTALGQVTVALKVSGAGAGGGEGLLLRDVAEISGTGIGVSLESLGGIVVVPAAELAGTREVSIDQVRRALEAAKVNLGRVSLRGSVCRVGVGTASASGPVRRGDRPGKGQASEDSTPPPQYVDIQPDANGDSSIRALIARRLLELYSVGQHELRLGFDETDADLLNQIAAGRRVDVQPAGTGNSQQLSVGVNIYIGDRLELSRTTTVRPMVYRSVAVAREAIAKGQMIAPEQIEIGAQWLAPSARVPADEHEIVGSVASMRISPGSVIARTDVSPPVVCKRGDIVYVHVLSGPVTVKAKARAMAQARDGEVIQFKLDGSDRVFSARMSGPGVAVMLVDERVAGVGGVGGAGAMDAPPSDAENIDTAHAQGMRVTTGPKADKKPAVRPVRRNGNR